jgi:hypothetical protein
MRRNTRAKTHVAVGVLVLGMTGLPSLAQVSPPAITPLAPDASFSGMTLREWAAVASQWTFSIPKDCSPTREEVAGQFSSVGQRAPVWFLPAFGPGEHTMSCTIPGGQGIFIPAGGAMVFDTSGGSSERYRAETKRDVDKLPVPEVSVDGASIPEIKQYRVQTPPFTLMLPPGNVFDIDVPEGKTKAVHPIADFYAILLPPLSAGRHVIHNRLETPGGVVAITYEVTVRSTP